MHKLSRPARKARRLAEGAKRGGARRGPQERVQLDAAEAEAGRAEGQGTREVAAPSRT